MIQRNRLGHHIQQIAQIFRQPVLWNEMAFQAHAVHSQRRREDSEPIRGNVSRTDCVH